jgi:hypothetical protein
MQQQSGNTLKIEIFGEVNLALKNTGKAPTSKLNEDLQLNGKEKDLPKSGEEEASQLTTRSATTVTNLDTSPETADVCSATLRTITQTSALTSLRRKPRSKMNVLMRMPPFLLSILK